MDLIQEELKERLGDKLEFNVLLKNYTTMGVGGIADYFLEVNNVGELIAAVDVADKLSINFVVMGSGSNVIPSDYGINGLVIHNKSSNIVINQDRGEVIADSGVSLPKLLNLTASNDLGGIEFLAGIPGTLGGAIYGNAGGRSNWIGDYVKGVTIIDKIRGELKAVKHNQEWMEFDYRSTKLKKNSINNIWKPVILTAHLRLPHKRNDEILKSIQENIKLRKDKQPFGQKTAGSFFKNLGKIDEQAAGYLLEKSGAKKLKVGDAVISKKHANFIINSKNASAKDIRKLADRAKQLVLENYNVILEEEVEYIGKW